ncbi:MAG: tripartite tricarboxylate transporter substrate binding protein [Betaproteobacteria bacterium]|nr:tripartite tricarboxylate transporter substrate binding protein [Betaproteobacteria bacterium]
MKLKQLLIAAAAAGLSSINATPGAHAQAFPTKPIELVVHTSAGSGGDLVSRTVAEIIRVNKWLPHQLQVNNRVGGAGVIGWNYFKTKRGDPYTIMSVTGTILVMAYRPDVNIPLDSYTPLALFAIDPQTIMVPANSPLKTFKDLMAAVRTKPESLVAATTSATGTGRLLLHLMEKQAPGSRIKFVTFKGGGEATTNTAGGHTSFTTENLGEGMGFVEGKQLRVLAIASDKRLPQAPDVPTLVELGFPITAGTIRGFTYTAGVPKEAVTVMTDVLKRAHDSQQWKEFAARNMFQDIYMGPEQFAKFLATRMEEYKEFYDAIGLAKKP